MTIAFPPSESKKAVTRMTGFGGNPVKKDSGSGLSYNLSLRQKLALFWSRLSRFWKILATVAITVVVGIFSASITVGIVKLLEFFGIEISTGIRSGISGGILGYLLSKYVNGLDYKKPTEPFKLRLFALPKKISSLEMWVAEAPYTAVFILIVMLCLAKYGQDFQQSGLPSAIEIFLVLFFLSGVYVLCVLAQGYRDFAKQEWGPRRNGRHVHRRTTAPRRYQS